MKDQDQERWMVWMVQARRFAERDNFPDAVARMKLVHDEIAAAVVSEADRKRKPKLQRLLERVEKELEDLRSQHTAWLRRIAERRQAKIDHADEELARPLPMPTE